MFPVFIVWIIVVNLFFIVWLTGFEVRCESAGCRTHVMMSIKLTMLARSLLVGTSLVKERKYRQE